MIIPEERKSDNEAQAQELIENEKTVIIIVGDHKQDLTPFYEYIQQDNNNDINYVSFIIIKHIDHYWCQYRESL